MSGMPVIWVCEGGDGALVILDGVTRATRIALLAAGQSVRVEVTAKVPRAVGLLPKIGDLLP